VPAAVVSPANEGAAKRTAEAMAAKTVFFMSGSSFPVRVSALMPDGRARQVPRG
jgi:hypothetical protein